MRLSFLKVAMGGMKNLSPGWFEHTAKHLRCLQGLSETNCRGCKQKQQEAANLRRSCFSGMLFRTEQRSFVMRLQYASDLHLEIPANRDFMLAGALEPAADYLLLAGDISSLTGAKLVHSGIGARSIFVKPGLFRVTTTITQTKLTCSDSVRLSCLCVRMLPMPTMCAFRWKTCRWCLRLFGPKSFSKRRKSKKKSSIIVRYILMAN